MTITITTGAFHIKTAIFQVITIEDVIDPKNTFSEFNMRHFAKKAEVSNYDSKLIALGVVRDRYHIFAVHIRTNNALDILPAVIGPNNINCDSSSRTFI